MLDVLSSMAMTLGTRFCAAIILHGLIFPAVCADKKKVKPLTASEVFKRSVPAIVAIDCMDEKHAKISTASGFFVAENGKILTNVHVIQQCHGLIVRLSNGDIYDSAYLMELDPRRDLALIRIKAVSLPVLPLGDSNDIEVGQTVYSIGNPAGLQNTLQAGLVSGYQQLNGYRMVQVGASINPGNSGGPILDDQGRVIAIAVAKVNTPGTENLGFAIPINYAKGYLDSKTEMPFSAFAEALKRAVAANGGGDVASPPAVTSSPSNGVGTRTDVAAASAPTFGVIETIAGRDWKFTGEGMPALQVSLGESRGVACDRAGNVYATDAGNQAVVKIDTDGRLHILAGPDSAPQNRPSYPSGVAVDSSGAVYFGENGQRVRKILPSGEVVLIAGTDRRGFSPDGSTASRSAIGGIGFIAVAPDGTVVFSEYANNRVRRVDSQGRLQTVAGDGRGRFAGDGGPAEHASLLSPDGLAYDGQGNLFIADQGNGRVRKIGRDGTISTIAGPGVTRHAPGLMRGLAVNSKGDVFAADSHMRQILVFRNGESSIFAGTGIDSKELSGQGGPATAASFDGWGLAVSPKDELIISGPDYGHIYRIGQDGTFSIIAGTGNWRAPKDGMLARNAWFHQPSHLTLDSTGSIFLSDGGAQRIYRIDQRGLVTKLAGTGRPAFFGENVLAKDSAIYQPKGLRVRANGTVVFVENRSNRVREITSDGKLRTLAGDGRAEYAGDGGQATSAALNGPYGICLDSSGNIYVADTSNQRIRKITPSGTIQLVAGDGARGYSGDGGPPERASLNGPTGIEIGPDGALYIADSRNYRVRKIANGIITTAAGDGNDRFAGDGGPAVKASLTWPYDLAFGPDRALYVLDTNGARIRRIDSASGIITTVAGNGSHTVSGDGGSPLQAGLGDLRGLAIDSAGNLYAAEQSTGRVRIIRANTASPREISMPHDEPTSSSTPAIQVSADRMETFLRGKLGVWTAEDAKIVLGAVRDQHQEQAGIFLTFATAGTNFSTAALEFSAGGKLATITLSPARPVEWAHQLAYMKEKFPGDTFTVAQSGDNTSYIFNRSRTSFLVQPDGKIASMSIF